MHRSMRRDLLPGAIDAAGAAFFLLAGVIAEQRGPAADQLMAGPPPQATWLKVAFLVLATTAGRTAAFLRFRRQADAADDAARSRAGPAIWVVLLAAGFVVMIALARDGCYLVWKHRATTREEPAEAIAWQSHRHLAAGRRRPLAGSRRAPAVRLR
jgi:hypothetical protein